jgi:hypothetical protein
MVSNNIYIILKCYKKAVVMHLWFTSPYPPSGQKEYHKDMSEMSEVLAGIRTGYFPNTCRFANGAVMLGVRA